MPHRFPLKVMELMKFKFTKLCLETSCKQSFICFRTCKCYLITSSLPHPRNLLSKYSFWNKVNGDFIVCKLKRETLKFKVLLTQNYLKLCFANLCHHVLTFISKAVLKLFHTARKSNCTQEGASIESELNWALFICLEKYFSFMRLGVQ